jgi:hypothetical protein
VKLGRHLAHCRWSVFMKRLRFKHCSDGFLEQSSSRRAEAELAILNPFSPSSRLRQKIFLEPGGGRRGAQPRDALLAGAQPDDGQSGDGQRPGGAQFQDVQRPRDVLFQDVQRSRDAQFQDVRRSRDALFQDVQRSRDAQFRDAQRSQDGPPPDVRPRDGPQSLGVLSLGAHP